MTDEDKWEYIQNLHESFWAFDSGIGTRMAKAGYAVYGIDHEGHGKSSGLLGYTPSFDNLVNDFLDYFTSVCGR